MPLYGKWVCLWPDMGCHIKCHSPYYSCYIYILGFEVWGVDSTFKDSDPFEKLHIEFIKEILGIHCKASNDGCRAELNRTPLKSKILFSIFNFMNHIIS